MPDTARNDASSEEEESDEEIVLPVKKKSFGFRVAQQANPAQAAQQVLSQIGNLASQRQVNEVVVETAAVAEKSEAEKKALEERKRLQDAQALAKAQQAAALQAAAARVAQAQANGGAAKAQEEAIARAKEAQARAQQEAQAKQQAALKAQQEAQAKQLAAQKEAQLKQQQALQKAQQEAQAKQLAAQKAQQEAQAKQLAAQKEAQAKQLAAQKAQQQAIQKAQQEAQAKQQQQQHQKVQPAPQKTQTTQQQTIQKTSQAQPTVQKTSQPQNGAVKQGPQVPQKFQNGALANSQPIQQEVHAATGPKWSRTPSKVQTQGPQPETPRNSAQFPTPQGNSALRQTAQIQEQQLAQTTPATKTAMLATKPHIQADHLSEKFVEKQEENLGKLTIERGKQLDGAKKWMVDSAARENHINPAMQLEHGPKAVILDNDACWQTQRRVAAEIQQPQVGRIQIPELSEKEIQRTIVAQPASYHKVAWNEFPEEAKFELGAAPRTKTQEWTPVNQEQVELQRSLYRPSRISAVWPPPQDEILKEGHSPMVVKASDDTAWIQQDQNGVIKQTVWGNNASRINRVWPPPEHENSLSEFSGPQHMPVVQWPPPEAEQHEREQVEVLQKHIPTKRMERQWPPPPPQYHVVESTGEIETRYNPAEQQQTTIIQQEVQPAFHQQQQIVRQVIKN